MQVHVKLIIGLRIFCVAPKSQQSLYFKKLFCCVFLKLNGEKSLKGKNELGFIFLNQLNGIIQPMSVGSKLIELKAIL